MTRVTMRMVAEQAGVSVKTVSNVVNNTGWVTDRTRAAVQGVLDELNYRVNASARQLRSGRSGLIAVALPELDQPYFAELASQFVAVARERNLTLLLNQTDGIPERELEAVNADGMPAVDGIVLSAETLDTAQLAERRDSAPLVILGEQDGTSAFPHVTIENERVAISATEFLLHAGRRRIGVIGAQQVDPHVTSDLRLAGFRRALRDAGIDPDQAPAGQVAAYTRTEGYRATLAVLDSGADIDGLFCFSDLLAIGALRALRERGVPVPEAVAVIGIDDIEEGTFSVPSLTTVSFSKRQVAEVALDLLADMQAGGLATGTTRLVPHHIVERASTP